MMTTAQTVRLAAVVGAERPPLADLLTRPGTGAVLLAGSKDPNAKVTVVLLDDYGPAFVVKAPTTAIAAQAVRHEGALLGELRGAGLGSLATTLPQPVGYLDADGLPALITNALAGIPMTVRYHGWRHTARRRRVRADFAAAGAWLADLQSRTAGRPAAVTMLRDSLVTIAARFPDHPGLAPLRRQLTGPAARLAAHATPRTVVHGDYWYGNLLVDGNRVVGVVDWEAGALAGEPLRDVARFAVSYALYLDRHVRPGHRVPGHRGLRAGTWGAGLAYAADGRGWFGRLVRDYLTAGLARFGLPGQLWSDLALAGIAEVAAGADHPEFARRHLDLLVQLTAGGTS
jgi:aminoglycoside phosphotransferase (APT) family kinase protein